MRAVDIITKKRDGGVLTAEEIRFFVTEYTAGNIPDYQASALLMAICLKGMTAEETACLTLCIRDSGDVADLSAIQGIKVDKHSTGGVGDKTTLVVAPIVAACGVKVAKISGRGLGHTGGTIDKLESIEGFCTTLDKSRFVTNVNSIGLAVIGQSGNIAPADKKLYALRDVTGTVESLPLIASSIMGKKLASGADSIVLDVKVGSGAFNKTLSAAKALAHAMVDIGKAAGKPTVALITDMETPLGNAVGNALEVAEAIHTLSGKGESRFVALCTELAAHMLVAANKGDVNSCRALAADALSSGRAMAAFGAMVAAQGGNTACLYDTSLLPTASVVHPIYAKESGYITRQDALLYGRAALVLGAGRARKEDSVDHSAGVYIAKKHGAWVNSGEVVAYLHTNNPGSVKEAAELVEAATDIGAHAPQIPAIVLDSVM